MDQNLSSSGFPTPGSSAQGTSSVDEQGDADMMDFDDDELDQVLADLELHGAGYNHPIPNQGQLAFEQLQNQPVLQQSVDQTAFQQLMNQQVFQQPLNQPGFQQPLNQANIGQDFNQVAPHQALNQFPVGQGQASNQFAAVQAIFPQAPVIINEPGFAAPAPMNMPANGYAHAGKTISQMMEENTPDTYQGYITSHEHAERLEAEYTQLASAQIASTIRPESLVDLPGSPEQEREWRKKIFEAIRDFRNVVNKPRRKDTKDKHGNIIKTEWLENTHVRRVREMKGAATELMGDKILELAVNAHRGIGGIPPWVDKKSWTLERFPTFNARMQFILEGLRTNKSIAHSYIQVDPTKRFVAGPKAEVRGKTENMNGNEKKGGLISDGREARQNEGN